jgi:ribosomal protein S18 acetylase RimI-like enzyme
MNRATVRQITQDRGKICNELLRSLPRWFGIESAIQRYVSDVERMTTFVACVEERRVGLASLHLHNEYTAELHVIAVHPEFHRKGIGRLLMNALESHLKPLNYEFLSVKTLSSSRPNEEYEKTRKFYAAMGFRPVEEFRTLWGEANPCLLMIKAL